MSDSAELRGQLRDLQTELVEAAVTFDRRGRLDAADLALSVSARLGELLAASAEHETADQH
jgi:hypothetical protein